MESTSPGACGGRDEPAFALALAMKHVHPAVANAATDAAFLKPILAGARFGSGELLDSIQNFTATVPLR